MPDKVCVYNFSQPETWMCNIFKLGDMVRSAGGNYTQLSVSGGVVAIHIQWICNLDWDFMKYCLPKYVLVTQNQSIINKKGLRNIDQIRLIRFISPHRRI